MNQQLTVKYACVCGRDCYYPDSEVAKILLSMCRTGRGVRKAFLKDDLLKLEQIGYQVEVLHPRIVYEGQ